NKQRSYWSYCTILAELRPDYLARSDEQLPTLNRSPLHIQSRSQIEQPLCSASARRSFKPLHQVVRGNRLIIQSSFHYKLRSIESLQLRQRHFITHDAGAAAISVSRVLSGVAFRESRMQIPIFELQRSRTLFRPAFRQQAVVFWNVIPTDETRCVVA